MIDPIKKIMSLFALLLISAASFAQNDQPVEMATGLYQSGKIYVVVIVLSVIFIGIHPGIERPVDLTIIIQIGRHP